MNPGFARGCRALGAASGVAAVGIGSLVLVGWTARIGVLRSVFPGGATMKPLTATGFILAGTSCWLLRRRTLGARWRVIGLGAAVLTALVGGLSLLQWQLALDLGVDRLILPSRVLEVGGSPFPGRMSPATAMSFLLLGTSLALCGAASRTVRGAVDVLALLVVLSAWVALNGYALDTQALYRTFAFSTMALHTASLFLLLGLSVLAEDPGRGLASLLAADDAGGRVARTLLPVAAILPVVLGLAATLSTRSHLIDPDFHEAVFGIVYGVIFSVVILAGARSASRLEAEVRAAQAQAVQSARLASVGTLAAGVAHEINNPLAYLMASLGFLEERRRAVPGAPFWDESAVQALEDAQAGATRVRDIVKGLRTFSRGEEDRRVPIQVGPALASAIQIAAAEWKFSARLVTDLRPTPTVLADEGRLGQVFLNLLVNAAQSIPQGRARENEIRVTTRTGRDGAAVIEIEDTGAGIPADVLGRIFDPFFTTKPVGRGTGLGLSVSQNIVQALGGRIEVESTVGKGSRFRVILPAAPRERSGRTRGADGAPGEALRPPGAGRLRVLVVDDEPALCSAVQRILAVEHEVEVSTRAPDVIGRVRAGERWDVILCDLMMADATGMDLHEAVLAVDARQAERTIFMTGGAFTDEARAFLERVPNARLAKPFEPEGLKALVRAVGGGHGPVA